MVCVILQNLLWPVISVVLTGTNYRVSKMGRYNKYWTKQLNTHTYTCTHTSWWLVLGWVNTKEYLPRLWFDHLKSTCGALTNVYNNNTNAVFCICANKLHQNLMWLINLKITSSLHEKYMSWGWDTPKRPKVFLVIFINRLAWVNSQVATSETWLRSIWLQIQ